MLSSVFIAFMALSLLLLVVGVLWGTWLSLARSMESFSGEAFLVIGKQMIKNLALPMRILMPMTLLCITVLAVIFGYNHNSTASCLALGGLGFMLGVIGITLIVNVPIDRQIACWTTDTLPSDWHVIRRRWTFFHAIRTWLSLGAFGLVLIAALIV